MKADVVCIGQAVVDCITRGKEEDEHKKNVYRAKSITLNVGGDAVNESSVLAELGYKVRILCGLGDDLAGKIIRDELSGHGVITDSIVMRDTLSTPIANLIVNGDGTRNSINGEAVMLKGLSLDLSALKGAKIVSLASLFRAPLDKKDEIITLVKRAREEGCVICADTKLPTFRQIHLKDIQEILPWIDYIFPNENEAAYYTGKESYEEMAREIHHMGVKNVIIKMGDKGCLVWNEEEHFTIPARKVKVVDTTGAGDNFVAGFLAGLLQGWNLRECAEFGTDCAAFSVQYVGATTAITKHKSDFLEKQED